VRLVFLQRVGGGYVFIHRLLLEHFASLEGMKPVAEASKLGMAHGGQVR
jgi:hypothetical protein